MIFRLFCVEEIMTNLGQFFKYLDQLILKVKELRAFVEKQRMVLEIKFYEFRDFRDTIIMYLEYIKLFYRMTYTRLGYYNNT